MKSIDFFTVYYQDLYIMQEENWTSFKKMIYIKGDLKRIYSLWATPLGICSWFLSEATYKRNSHSVEGNDLVKIGDQYEWKWHNWEGKESGEIVETNNKDHLAFSFADGLVSIRLKEEKNRVLVCLEQRNIAIDEKSKMEIYNGCSNGWSFWLTNLKAFVEHGILLNETEIDLTSMEMSNFQFVNM